MIAGAQGSKAVSGRVGSKVRAIARTNRWRWIRVEDDLYRREHPKAIRRSGRCCSE